jgi:hypothetical protein
MYLLKCKKVAVTNARCQEQESDQRYELKKSKNKT